MNKPGVSGRVGTPAPVSAQDHILGPTDAPVTMIEYSDFQCPACAQYHPYVKRLVSEASTTLRLVYRHFPLDNIRPDGQVQHPNAVPAAIAAEAASRQGKFWEMHDLLFENQNDWAELKDANPVFETYATKLGLDLAKFKADLADKTIESGIQAEKSEGIRLGIDHTPTFFINGKVIDNPQSYEQFKTIVDAAASAGSR
jgi:protein-disulfide isomerase